MIEHTSAITEPLIDPLDVLQLALRLPRHSTEGGDAI